MLIAGSYGLRGGLGFDGNFFAGPNFALKEESKDAYTPMIYQMWTLNAESHTMIGKDEVKRLLRGAGEWFDEHVPPDKR